MCRSQANDKHYNDRDTQLTSADTCNPILLLIDTPPMQDASLLSPIIVLNAKSHGMLEASLRIGRFPVHQLKEVISADPLQHTRAAWCWQQGAHLSAIWVYLTVVASWVKEGLNSEREIPQTADFCGNFDYDQKHCTSRTISTSGLILSPLSPSLR